MILPLGPKRLMSITTQNTFSPSLRTTMVLTVLILFRRLSSTSPETQDAIAPSEQPIPDEEEECIERRDWPKTEIRKANGKSCNFYVYHLEQMMMECGPEKSWGAIPLWPCHSQPTQSLLRAGSPHFLQLSFPGSSNFLRSPLHVYTPILSWASCEDSNCATYCLDSQVFLWNLVDTSMSP